jgi:hypothetical protein
LVSSFSANAIIAVAVNAMQPKLIPLNVLILSMDIYQFLQVALAMSTRIRSNGTGIDLNFKKAYCDTKRAPREI